MIWKSDHPPRHVHVYRDGRLILRWNLEEDAPISGEMDARIRWIIAGLKREGLL
jgi:hypothetical protein